MWNVGVRWFLFNDDEAFEKKGFFSHIFFQKTNLTAPSDILPPLFFESLSLFTKDVCLCRSGVRYFSSFGNASRRQQTRGRCPRTCRVGFMWSVKDNQSSHLNESSSLLWSTAFSKRFCSWSLPSLAFRPLPGWISFSFLRSDLPARLPIPLQFALPAVRQAVSTLVCLFITWSIGAADDISTSWVTKWITSSHVKAGFNIVIVPCSCGKWRTF